MEDQTLRRLSKKVFPYIWLRHKLIPPVSSHGFFSFSEGTIFSQEIGKTVIIYLHMYRPVLSKYFEKHISSMPHSKMQFWTHVAFLCLQVRLTHDHVFDYFLTVCSVTAEVALHCYVNGYEDVLPFASVFLCAFFETEFYEGFHGAGGWVELHRYIQSTFCPELYELVDHHVRKIESPSDHLPILISIEREKLAAERRKKFLSIRSEKIGKIESDEQAKLLVSGIFHWDFVENQRISEIGPGILRRMENIRRKKKPVISLNEGRNEEPLEADNVMVTKNELSDADKLLCEFEAAGPSESVACICAEQSNHKSGQTLNESKYSSLNEGRNEEPLGADNVMVTKKELSDADKCEFEAAGPSESVVSMCEERSNQKSGQTLNELKYTEVSKEMGDSELYGKYKGNSRPSSNFYESTSSPTQTENENSKSFGNNNATIDGLKQSTIKGMPNEKVRNCERYPKFVPHSIENSITMPKTENVTPQTVIEIADSFRHDPLSEVSKTFQKLGFSCLCVGNSSRHDEKFNALTNYSEIMDQCHYFQNKYSSIQFAFLIPNEYFKEKTSQVSTTEGYDKTSFEEQYNEQQIPINEKKDFEYGSDSPQRHQSGTHKTRFRVTKVNENQFSFQNEPQLIQNCEQKYSDTVKKVEEIDLFSSGDSFKISRFSVTKINENPMTSKNKASSLETACTIKPLTAISSLKAEENHSKGQINALYENYASETTKTFTVKKIKEIIAGEETAAFGKNLRNESTETSRLNVSKINENIAKEERDVLRNICSNEKTKTSRFTVTKIKENVAGEETSTFENKWRNENTKISRFTVTKIEENKSKNPVSILRKNLANETPKTSRFTVKKVSDDPLISRASTSLFRKSFPTNVSRFSVTKIDENETMLRGTINSSNEIFGDTENETVQFQENGSVKYQKRVSFSEIPFISFFQPYSSDDSPNSKTSRESLNENSPEEPRFLRDSTQSGPKEDISSTPTSRNVAPPERQGLFRHHTFNASQTSNNNTQSSNTSIGLGRLSRMFRSNSGRSKTRGEKKK